MSNPRLVVHMVIDDLGREQIGRLNLATASPGLASQPFFDFLYDEGIYFEQHFAEAFCSPYRACALTGRHTEDTGVGNIIESDLQQPLLLRELLLPEVLKAYYGAAIQTACIGKWHLGNAQVGGKKSPLLAGFDYWFGSERNLLDFYNDNLYLQGDTVNAKGRFIPELLADAAITWLRRFAADKTRKGYLYLPWHLPHNPFYKPPTTLYDAVTWVCPTLQPASQVTSAATPYFKAYQESLNTLMQRVWDSIPEALKDETVLLVSSDNGTEAAMLALETYPVSMGGGSYQAGHGKRSNYDPGIHTPAWAYSTNSEWCVNPGRQVTGLIQSVDWFSTTLDLFGVPWQEIDEIRGPQTGVSATERSKSFAANLTSDLATTDREYAYLGIFSPNGYNRGTASGSRAITDGRYKLLWGTATTISDAPGFYDIVTAPKEDSVAPVPVGTVDANQTRLQNAMNAFYRTMPDLPAT